MPRRRSEGVLGVFTGSSRQGKTHQVKKRMKKEARTVVWSVKESIDRYADVFRNTIIVRGGLHELRRVLFDQIGKKSGHVVYVPRSLDEAGAFSKIVHAWAIHWPCCIVFEEVADFTSPAKAPSGYGNLLRQVLGFGANVYVVTQRPAESDKTAIGNCTFLHAHFMSRAKDRKYMAEEMNLPVEKLAGLKKYEWIERWGGGALKSGK